jgi:hypothetical protein
MEMTMMNMMNSKQLASVAFSIIIAIIIIISQ